jgi:phenylacetate-CoA ligase
MKGDRSFWKKDIETAERKVLAEIKLAKLEKMLDYVDTRSPFYREKFRKEKVSISTVQAVKDLEHLPFTTRDEIVADQEEHGRLGTLMATAWSDPGQTIGLTGVKISATGKQIRVILSMWDSAFQGRLGARGLVGAGVTNLDYFYLHDFPQFNPIYMNMGLSSINAGSKVLSVGMERAERNATIFPSLYPPAVYFINPTYSRFVMEIIERSGKKLPVRTVVGWGEPGYSLPSVRKGLEKRWAALSTEEVRICDMYAMVEVGILGFECRQQAGIHAFEDGYIYEIIDPETHTVLPPGQEGELVVTHLEREGMPLIRYRTGDITAIDDGPCACGRTHVRLRGIKGRYAERLQILGKSVYVSQVEEIIGRTGYQGPVNVFTDGSLNREELDVGIAQAGVAPSLEKAVTDALGVPVRVRAEDELFVFPHRSYKLIDRTKMDLYRTEVTDQTKTET